MLLTAWCFALAWALGANALHLLGGPPQHGLIPNSTVEELSNATLVAEEMRNVTVEAEEMRNVTLQELRNGTLDEMRNDTLQEWRKDRHQDMRNDTRDGMKDHMRMSGSDAFPRTRVASHMHSGSRAHTRGMEHAHSGSWSRSGGPIRRWDPSDDQGPTPTVDMSPTTTSISLASLSADANQRSAALVTMGPEIRKVGKRQDEDEIPVACATTLSAQCGGPHSKFKDTAGASGCSSLHSYLTYNATGLVYSTAKAATSTSVEYGGFLVENIGNYNSFCGDYISDSDGWDNCCASWADDESSANMTYGDLATAIEPILNSCQHKGGVQGQLFGVSIPGAPGDGCTSFCLQKGAVGCGDTGDPFS